jgi:lysozyme
MRLHEWLVSLMARSSAAAQPAALMSLPTMRMSADGRKRLMQREGVRLVAYKDTVGVWTVGVGHSAAAGPPIPKRGMVITMAECEAIFARDLRKYEDAVNANVRAPLTQGEFDALVSLCFNIGPGAFKTSSVVKKLNMNDRAGAARAILLWNKPPEIQGRRKTEYQQFAMAAGIPQDQWIA